MVFVIREFPSVEVHAMVSENFIADVGLIRILHMFHGLGTYRAICIGDGIVRLTHFDVTTIQEFRLPLVRKRSASPESNQMPWQSVQRSMIRSRVASSIGALHLGRSIILFLKFPTDLLQVSLG